MEARHYLMIAILRRSAQFGYVNAEDVPSPINKEEDIESFFYESETQEAESEFREGQVETDIECEYSRHYESKSVASKIDGKWIGWTYWYGGGKHAEPESIDWIEYSYFLDCKEEEKLVIVRSFTKKP